MLIDLKNSKLLVYFGTKSDVTIPSSVTSIGDYAFWGCASLKSIVIPSSVTSIGDLVFRYCSSLESIIIPEDSVERFKVILPRFWWNKLYYLKKAVDIKELDRIRESYYSDLPF
jgi:hypothetical protein